MSFKFLSYFGIVAGIVGILLTYFFRDRTIFTNLYFIITIISIFFSGFFAGVGIAKEKDD